IAQSPRDPQVLGDAGEVAYWRHRYVEALHDFRASAALDPRDARVWALRSQVAYLIAGHDEAAFALRRARRLDPSVLRRRFIVDFQLLQATLDKEGETGRRWSEPPPESSLTAEDQQRDSVTEQLLDDDQSGRSLRRRIAHLNVWPDSIVLALGDSVR